MKLSTRARYALKAMMVIARESEKGKPMNLAEVAERGHISYRYLEQVAISLKNAGILKGVSGKNGGHALSRPAGDIRLGEIVEAAIGRINVVDCVHNPDECMWVDDCECRVLYCLINQRIRNTLNSFTLADLADGLVEEKAGKAP